MTIGPGLVFRAHARFGCQSFDFQSNANQATICTLHGVQRIFFDSTCSCSSCPRHLRLRSGSLGQNEVQIFRPSPVQFVFEKLIEALLSVIFVTFVISNCLVLSERLANLRCRVSFLETLTTSPTFSQPFQISNMRSMLEMVDKRFLIASLNGFKSTTMPNPPIVHASYNARFLFLSYSVPNLISDV
jgi:hypothetical protein